MDEIGTVTTCGSCDWDANGYKLRCDDPAPYRAEYRCTAHDDCGDRFDYTLPVCVRHANDARTHHSLKRIYSARDDHHGTAD